MRSELWVLALSETTSRTVVGVIRRAPESAGVAVLGGVDEGVRDELGQ
ncbi:hypothetical protein [Actinomyces denticolens]|nr:hypothetical protein [Actinomyces denticolens]